MVPRLGKGSLKAARPRAGCCSQQAGVNLRASELRLGLANLRVVGPRPLGRGLLLVVPVADAAKVVERVVVAIAYVVHINSRFVAHCAGRQTDLAPGTIPSMYLPPQCLPVRRESGLAV